MFPISILGRSALFDASSVSQAVSETSQSDVGSGVLGLIFGGLLILAGLAYFATLIIVARRKKKAGDYILKEPVDSEEGEEE